MEPHQQIQLLARQYQGVYLRLPLIVGNEAVNFTLDNFRLQGFMGNTFQPWLSRKQGWRKDRRTGRNILIDTGRLRRSIRITQLSQNHVAIGTDVKYARAHNEGLRMGFIQSVKAHTRKVTGITTIQSISTRRSYNKRVQVGTSHVNAHTRRIDQRIPKRQFMGDSPYLRARLKRVALAEFMREIRFIKP